MGAPRAEAQTGAYPTTRLSRERDQAERVKKAMSALTFVILEKDDDLRALYRRKLEQRFKECTVVDTPSCEEAFEVLRRSPVDAVVVNQRPMGCTGTEALKALRRLDPNIPLVSIGPGRVETEALANGANAFLDDRKWGDLATTVERILVPR